MIEEYEIDTARVKALNSIEKRAAIETGEPITLKNARIIAEYLREGGWSEGAIGAVMAHAATHVRRGRATPYELPLDHEPGPPSP